ncbi:hypothetical protein GIB67_033971 [Kingdonia uniflora]|uniref:Uncharacterized protein n=1 Tax=Kingdonia uniflora TaxID=39325 RepID=A0A7J7M609_9MAGN|nr:hypothetical protein GIB67_033971 [Kingdonia uniflora]
MTSQLTEWIPPQSKVNSVYQSNSEKGIRKLCCEHKLIELHKHVSFQRIFVQDLMTGICREWEEWNQVDGETSEAKEDPPVCNPLLNEVEIHRMAFLENIDVLFAEHKVEEALEALDTEEKSFS